jgi:hypothetical protein
VSSIRVPLGMFGIERESRRRESAALPGPSQPEDLGSDVGGMVIRRRVKAKPAMDGSNDELTKQNHLNVTLFAE